MGFGKVGEIFVEFGKGIVYLGVGFGEVNLGAREKGSKDRGGEERDGVFGICAVAEEREEGFVGVWVLEEYGREGGDVCGLVSFMI